MGKEMAGAIGSYSRGMKTHENIMGLMMRDYQDNPYSTSINSAVLAMNDFGDAKMMSGTKTPDMKIDPRG